MCLYARCSAAGVLALLLGAVALVLMPGIAQAGDITLTGNVTVEDLASCTAIGGEHRTDGSTGPSCTIDAGSALTIPIGLTLTIGDLDTSNHGEVHVGGILANEGKFSNEGSIDNGHIFDTSGAGNNFINDGTFTNYGDMLGPAGSEYSGSLDIENSESGAIANHGTIEIDFTLLRNYGSIENTGQIITQHTCGGCPPSLIDNYGTIDNDGAILNDGGFLSAGVVNSRGSFTNTAYLSNDGVFTNAGVFANTGGESPRFVNDGAFFNACGATYIGEEPEGTAVQEMLCCYLPSVIH